MAFVLHQTTADNQTRTDIFDAYLDAIVMNKGVGSKNTKEAEHAVVQWYVREYAAHAHDVIARLDLARDTGSTLETYVGRQSAHEFMEKLHRIAGMPWTNHDAVTEQEPEHWIPLPASYPGAPELWDAELNPAKATGSRTRAHLQTLLHTSPADARAAVEARVRAKREGKKNQNAG